MAMLEHTMWQVSDVAMLGYTMRQVSDVAMLGPPCGYAGAHYVAGK